MGPAASLGMGAAMGGVQGGGGAAGLGGLMKLLGGLGGKQQQQQGVAPPPPLMPGPMMSQPIAAPQNDMSWIAALSQNPMMQF